MRGASLLWPIQDAELPLPGICKPVIDLGAIESRGECQLLLFFVARVWIILVLGDPAQEQPRDLCRVGLAPPLLLLRAAAAATATATAPVLLVAGPDVLSLPLFSLGPFCCPMLIYDNVIIFVVVVVFGFFFPCSSLFLYFFAHFPIRGGYDLLAVLMIGNGIELWEGSRGEQFR